MEKHLRTYETICITKVDMPDDKFGSLMERCKSAVTQDGKGEVLMTDDWGRAKIAYTIGKDNRGRWTYLRFKSLPEGVDEIQRSLKINEYVLRQLTVRTSEDGSDYTSLRENMPKELQDRDRPRDWRDERGPRREFGGPRREYGGGGGRGDYGDHRGGAYGDESRGRSEGGYDAPGAGDVSGAGDEE
jgi:small subunit ribosomal protein S6